MYRRTRAEGFGPDEVVLVYLGRGESSAGELVTATVGDASTSDEECRPISKTKAWTVKQLLEKARPE